MELDKFMLGAALIAGLFVLWLALVYIGVTHRWRGVDACWKCGYSLYGIPSTHDCPECGALDRFESTRGWIFTSKRIGKSAVGMSIVVAAAMCVLAKIWLLNPLVATVEIETVADAVLYPGDPYGPTVSRAASYRHQKVFVVYRGVHWESPLLNWAGFMPRREEVDIRIFAWGEPLDWRATLQVEPARFEDQLHASIQNSLVGPDPHTVAVLCKAVDDLVDLMRQQQTIPLEIEGFAVGGMRPQSRRTIRENDVAGWFFATLFFAAFAAAHCMLAIIVRRRDRHCRG